MKAVWSSETDHRSTIVKMDLPSTPLAQPSAGVATCGSGDPMTDLRTTYLGLRLRSPLVASASPAAAYLHGLLALQDAEVAAFTA